MDLYIREVSREVVELVITKQITQASDGDQSDYIYCHCKTGKRMCLQLIEVNRSELISIPHYLFIFIN